MTKDSNSNPVCRRTALLPRPDTAADASASPLFSSDVDVQYELSALEQQWARDGIIMKASTFFVAFASEIIPTSSA